MIHFICGRAGSGKTSLVCELAAKALDDCAHDPSRRVFLIVPEQSAVDTEQRMADLCENKSVLSLEVLNFKRLCNRIFREYGGLSYRYITDAGRSLMMWQTLTELAPMLSGDAPVDKNSVKKMLGAVSEFKAYRVSPIALERAAKSLENERLTNKLLDLSLIFASYINLVGEVCDDAADDLTKAAEILRDEDFFSGTDVFFDGFNGYTPQEFAVMEQIFKKASSVTVSLCMDPDTPDIPPFENQKYTAERLETLAARTHHEIKITKLTASHRAKSPELAFLEKHLWSLDLTADSAFSGSADAIRLFECRGLWSECEAVAADICRRVRAGAAYRDHAIILRGTDRYDGILDAVMEKYGIPLFISHRTDIREKPLIKLILSVFSVRMTNFRTADMIGCIKTGLCGISPDDVHLLENYVTLWNIRGASRWSSDWDMNPDGFSEMTEEGLRTIHRVNSLRETVMIPLSDFFGALESAETVRDYARCLYDYLLALDMPHQLAERAAARRETDPADAAETAQIWGILVDALDELCRVMPDMPCDGAVFAELLGIIFDEIDIGRIPGTVDEVTAGDASLLRTARRHIYVIGANEGIFPLAPSDDGVFSDQERELLLSNGIELAGTQESRAADERFAFYRALTSASESVTLLWSSADMSGRAMRPSVGVTRLLAMFSSLKPVLYDDLPLEVRMEGTGKLLEYAAEAAGTPLGLALRRFAEENPDLGERLSRLDIPLCDDTVRLAPETCREISHGDLALTQSRLESYVLCHFSYYCKYILKLEEKKSSTFDAADIGSFIHKILERFVLRAEETGTLGAITDSELDRLVDDIIGDYMKTICRIAPDYTGSRLHHLFSRLRRSSRLLCRNLADEFAQSSFRPAFYELPIKFPEPGENTVAPLKIPLSDGSHAYVYGIADRVDTYFRDGKCYVRVIDYKTGSKEFSLEDVSVGLNLQMLLYLFSIWKNGASGALKPPPDTEIVPAGVLYFGAGVPTLTLDAPTPPDEVLAAVCDKLSRRGLLLDDADVLSAMEHELAGKYLPIKVKKDGSFRASDALTSLAGFGELLSGIEDTIRKIGGEIKRGEASAHPMKRKKQDACAFCAMKPVCRKGADDHD